MIRTILALAALSLAVPAAAQKINIGTCTGGQCSISKTISRSVVKQDTRGSLVRLTLLGGYFNFTSSHTGPKHWDKTTHAVYVFCSTRLPAVILPDGRHFQTDAVDLADPTGPSEIDRSAYTLYLATCLNNNTGGISAAAARRMGYRRVPFGMVININRPEDIFTARYQPYQ